MDKLRPVFCSPDESATEVFASSTQVSTDNTLDWNPRIDFSLDTFSSWSSLCRKFLLRANLMEKSLLSLALAFVGSQALPPCNHGFTRLWLDCELRREACICSGFGSVWMLESTSQMFTEWRNYTENFWLPLYICAQSDRFKGGIDREKLVMISWRKVVLSVSTLVLMFLGSKVPNI